MHKSGSKMYRTFPCINFDGNLYIKIYEVIEYEFDVRISKCRIQCNAKFVIK